MQPPPLTETSVPPGASPGSGAAATPGPGSSPAPGAGASSSAAAHPDRLTRRVTVRTLRAMVEAGTPFACLTAYDAVTARWLERGGVPVLLVGDTAAEMVLGFDGTIRAPLDFMLMITAAVRRGAPRAFILGDMPFMSYQASPDDAMVNAGRFLTEGFADAVKLEVDGEDAPLVRRMARAGIPVVAHIGCRPQHVKLSGYRTAGTTAAEARAMIDDARRLEDAGSTMLLIEAAPDEVSARIVEQTSLPVIGCGAGPACHGQIVVTQDLLGLTDRQPSFATPMRDLGTAMVGFAADWRNRVGSRDLGPHPYRMKAGEAERLDD
ncbi:MAG: 3-methyl-2-oxobutanoate hydroxymethyltransferase [Phycisphaerales bacterium]